jgi:hypothetical protein
MENDLSSFLAGGHHHASISPEMLEVLGKQAANLYLDEHVALNEAVVKVASAYDDISAEQVKRVVEFANTATYLALHEKNKTAGVKTSYPQFALADPGQVLQNMDASSRPTVVTQVDKAYGQQPEREKVSAAEDPREAALAEMFGVKEKTAEIDFSKDTALHEVTSAKDMLVGMRDSLRGSVETLDLMHKEASAELYEKAKRHVLDGGSMADIYRAVAAGSDDLEKVSEVLRPIVVGFLRENVMSAEAMKRDMGGIDKVAHRLINPENSMVKTAQAVMGCSEEIKVVANGLEEVEPELKKVDDFLRSHLLG